MDTSTQHPMLFSERQHEHHALVLGGSMAGLLTARVLSDYFDQVTIVDRDIFPEAPDHRKGVPQSYHAHALLPRGQAILDQLFPGLIDDLRNAGAHSVYGKVPFVIVSPAGTLPTQKQESEFIAFSRSLLEWHVRNHLVKRPGVHLLTNHEVTKLVATPDQLCIMGVQVRERGQEGHTEIIKANLVVDASGRHSQAPRWLTELGYDAPPEEKINSDLGYASRFYAKPPHFPDEWQGLIINGRAPNNPRAGLVLPIENGRWHVTLGGIAGNYPPTDEAGFMQWAHNLPDPSIYEALRVAEPLTPIRAFRTPENRVRHFERLQRWPKNFIVTGDAVCAFNPIYGQGITTSAMEALALDECLRKQQHAPAPDFARHFQQQLMKTIASPWLIATGEDLRWPGVMLSGARPPFYLAALHGYMNIVLPSAIEDLVVSETYQGVIAMFTPPTSLVQPRILLRVIWGALKRTARRVLQTSERSAPLALSPAALTLLRTMPEYQHETITSIE